jgi:hypothetical protein
MKTSSIYFQRRTALAWSLAFPIGWLLGWAIGATIGYNVPDLFTINRDSFGLHQLSQQIAASDGGILGGAIGIMAGWILAIAITICALHSMIPALKSFHIILIFLGWVLPLVLFVLAFYLLIGGL